VEILISLFRSLEKPFLIDPPYTIRNGRLCRAAAMITPGIFLSHPGIEMLASWCCVG
jgi:hypothetical protein